MSNFYNDLATDEFINEYLDIVYKKLGYRFIRVSDSTNQHKGIDVFINTAKDNYTKNYCIDEKAQTSHLNQNLPTFAFELSYLKDNNEKIGWLLDKNKDTEFYMLVSQIHLHNSKKQLCNSSDIEKLKITVVNKKSLISYLAKNKLDLKKLKQYSDEVRKSNSGGKKTINELNTKSGYIYYTQNLPEMPVNLVLYLKPLIQKGIAKEIFNNH